MLSWSPLLWTAFPAFALALCALIVQAGLSASRAHFTTRPLTPILLLKLRALTALLHLAQPLARLRGRVRFGLTPWRVRGTSDAPLRAFRWRTTIWGEHWRSTDDWLGSIEEQLRRSGGVVLRGNDFDAWDLELRGGMFGSSRLSMMIEEHGGGKQLARFRVRPRVTPTTLILVVLFGAIAAFGVADRAWLAAVLPAAIAICVALRVAAECALSMSTFGMTLAESATVVIQPEHEAETAAVDANSVEELTTAGYASSSPQVPEAEPVLRAFVAAANQTRGAEKSSHSIVPSPAVSSVGSSLFRVAVSPEALLNLDTAALSPGDNGD